MKLPTPLERAEECQAVASEMFAQFEEAETHMLMLKVQLEEERRINAALAGEISSAKEEMIEKTEVANKALAAVKVCEVEKEALVKMNSDLGLQIDQFRACTAGMERTIQRTERCIRSLTQDMTRTVSECCSLREQVDTKTHAYLMLEGELESRHAANKREYDELENRYVAASSEIDRLRGEQNFYEQKERQSNEDVRVSTAEAAVLRAELASLRGSLQTSHEKLKAADAEVVALSSALKIRASAEDEAMKTVAFQAREAADALRVCKEVRDQKQEAERRLDVRSRQVVTLLIRFQLPACPACAVRVCCPIELTVLPCMHLTRDADQLKSELAKVKAELEKLNRVYLLATQELDSLKAQVADKQTVGVGMVITERHPHRVLTVVENGAAAACGEILEGDVIQGIDGTDVEDQVNAEML